MMKITAKKHIVEANETIKSSKEVVRASEEVDYSEDEGYLQQLADEIENVLLTDFDVDAVAWYASDGTIRITTDMYDSDAFEGLITQEELVGLTGDLETDAYSFAEEFYTSMP